MFLETEPGGPLASWEGGQETAHGTWLKHQTVSLDSFQWQFLNLEIK